MSIRTGPQASLATAVSNHPHAREMFDPSLQGHSVPLGATVCPGGVHVSGFSRKAHEVERLFFDRVDDSIPSRIVTLDREKTRSYHYWHIRVPRLGPGQIYAYRVHGPFDPGNGLRFDS